MKHPLDYAFCFSLVFLVVFSKDIKNKWYAKYMMTAVMKETEQRIGMGVGMGMVCNYKLSGKKVFTEKVTLEERSGGDDRRRRKGRVFQAKDTKVQRL